ncbi:N(6)-adenine-specific methyltransferase METTL4-like isoform X2 [Oscarella lobularis]|uniref:N(6)-adenine-specific methyltransferase METTL4-like isoform X2 n=1 Tax=Oscarella lobularis TaxID=121494 RepID=UPI0033142AEB
MAVVTEKDDGWLLDNNFLIRDQYVDVFAVQKGTDRGDSCRSGTWMPLPVDRPVEPYFSKSKRREAKKASAEEENEVEKQLKQSWLSIMKDSRTRAYLETVPPQKEDVNADISSSLASLCDLAKLGCDPEGPCPPIADISKGDEDVQPFNHINANLSDKPIEIRAVSANYLIPAQSTFLMSDITQVEKLVTCRPSCGYDAIVIDPPWENKSIRRSRRYESLPLSQIRKLPIRELLSSRGLVLLWITNRKAHIEYAKTSLFPTWNVELVAKWYWIKITTKGDLVFDMDSTHRKPFERLLIGRRQSVADSPPSKKQKLEDVPEYKVLCSVPSKNHSQKPILSEILRPYLPKDASCLEIFARNLIPKWTSWGNEVLKFQCADAYFKRCT